MAHVLRVLGRVEARQVAVSRSSFVPAVRARRHRALTPPRSLAAGVRASRDVRPVDRDGRVVRCTGRVAADDVSGDLQATARDCGVVAEHEIAADVVVRDAGSTTGRRSRTPHGCPSQPDRGRSCSAAGRWPGSCCRSRIPRLTVLSVIRRSRPTFRSQMPSNTNGKPGDPSIMKSWPTFTGPPGVFGELCPVCTVCGFDAKKSCPIVTLSRCVPPPRPSSCMSCPIVDRRMSAPDSSPRPTKSCPIDESEDVGAGIGSSGDDVVPDGRLRDVCSREVAEGQVVGRCSSPRLRARVVPLDQVVRDRRVGHRAEAALRDDQVVSRAGERERVLRADDVRRSRLPSPRTARAGTRRPSRPRRRRDVARFIVIPSSFRVAADCPPARYRVATDRLPSASRARVPRSGAAGGRRRGRPGQARRAASARDARDPAAEREPRRAGRAARGRAVRRPPARLRGHAGAAAGLGAAARARLGGLRSRRGRPDTLLRVRDDDFDLARFERLTARPSGRARATTPARAAALLREALDLWRGPPLADLAYESFAAAAVRAARGAAARGARGADRRRPLARPARGARRRARGARHRAPAARAPPRAADARAVPLRTAGRGARGLPRDAAGAGRELRHRAVGAAAGARAGDPDPGSLARARREHGAGAGRRRARRAVAGRPGRRARRAGRAHSGASSCSRGSSSGEDELAGASAAVGTAPRARADGGVHERRPGRRPRPARDRERGRPRARRRAPGSRRRAAPGTRSRSCSSARPRTSPCSRATLRSRGAASTCRSAAASTTGRRWSWAPGSPLRRARRCGSSARAPTRGAAAATRAACSPTRRSPSSASSTSTRRRCSPTRTGSSTRSRVRGLVVVGISPRWRHEGIGAARRALVRDARPPVLLVHRGPRPGLLAPRESRTRFTWTLDA